jgi:pantoate--beta-alanine ligase
MGALHDGHLTLVRRARQLADHVAVSIFVNPTQFAPTEDLNKYPRPIDADLAALRHEGVSMVFTPSNEAIYPPGFSTYVQPPRVAEELEGQIRPGHFRGVCTVVLKLFQIIPASVAVFGQKDFQQALVITNMVNDLCIPITIDVVPTVREPDGLAMSSRNRYLSSEERTRALCLSKALGEAKRLFDQGERWAAALQAAMMAELKPGQPHGVDTVDYAVIADRKHLGQFARVPDSAVALVAARIGTTRLIDNRLLIPSTP